MSTLKASITAIQSVENLNIVTCDFQGTTLRMMSLELSDRIRVGTGVSLAIKPTHIAIAKVFSGMISTSNQIEAIITQCNNGKLLSSIILQVGDTVLESIITCESAKMMDLKVGDEVTAMIKASDISIAGSA